MLYQARDGNLYRRWEQHCFPPTPDDSPARAEHVDLAWRDPEAARRERLRAQATYWRTRLQALRERAELLRALLGESELEDGVPAADRRRARLELAAAEGDVLEASWHLHQLEQTLGEKSAPLPAAPAPATLPPTGPRKPGRRVTCTCGECPKCRAREAMRRRRAAAKAVRAARKARGA